MKQKEEKREKHYAGLSTSMAAFYSPPVHPRMSIGIQGSSGDSIIPGSANQSKGPIKRTLPQAFDQRSNLQGSRTIWARQVIAHFISRLDRF